MYAAHLGRFVNQYRGFHIAYDAVTDGSRDFNDPSDHFLDESTNPHKGIVALLESDKDRFGGLVVGLFDIKQL